MNPVDQYGLSRIGKVRSQNQDAILLDPGRHIYLLADGMGGHKGGEVASAMALTIMHEQLTHGMTQSSWRATLTHSFEKAHNQIEKRSHEDANLSGMGTTAACALIDPQGLCHFVHVGDSRIYLLTEHLSFFQLSQDHAMTLDGNPYRQVLTRSLGHTDPIEVDYLHYKPTYPIQILICSDGLSNLVQDTEIKSILTASDSCQQACETLVNQAYKAGGHDNVSVIVVYLK